MQTLLIQIRTPLLATLRQMHALAATHDLSIESYAAELLETSIVEFRALKITEPPAPPAPSPTGPPICERPAKPCLPASAVADNRTNARVCDKDRAAMRGLRSQGLTLAAIAERFHVAKHTVGRIVRERI